MGLEEDRRFLVNDEDDLETVEAESDEPAIEENCLNVVYLSAVVAAIGGLLFGYDVGVISGAKVQVAHEMGLTCGEEEALVGLMPIGALSASLVAGKLLNRFGRKVTIQLTGVAFTAGSLGMAFAGNLPVLLIGRFVVGFPVSLSAMSECLYISEISKPSNRGMLVSLNELGITIGFLLAFLVNYILMTTPQGWRIMFGLSSGLAIIQCISMCFLPETPHFLVQQKDEQGALEVIRLIHKTGSVRERLASIRHSCDTAMQASCSQLFSMEENMRWRTFVGLMLVALQQLSGQPNILYYATDIFQAVGFCGDSLSAMAAVGLGLVKVGATVVSLVLVDRVGRRTLLLIGSVLMSLSLLCLTVFAGYQYTVSGYHQRETCSHGFNYTEHHHKNAFSHQEHGVTDNLDMCDDNELPLGVRYIAFLALVVYVAAYSFSFGPITWIILTEIFPVSLKSEAMSLGQAVNWTTNVFVSVTFLDSIRIFTLPAVFSVYWVFAIISVVFIYLCVPETKGRSLEEISKDLKGEKPLKDLRMRVTKSNDETNFEPVPYINSHI